MPGLRDQLAQAAHNLVAFVFRDIAVVELFKTAVDLAQFVNQRAACNFSRVRG